MSSALPVRFEMHNEERYGETWKGFPNNKNVLAQTVMIVSNGFSNEFSSSQNVIARRERLKMALIRLSQSKIWVSNCVRYSYTLSSPFSPNSSKCVVVRACILHVHSKLTPAVRAAPWSLRTHLSSLPPFAPTDRPRCRRRWRSMIDSPQRNPN